MKKWISLVMAAVMLTAAVPWAIAETSAGFVADPDTGLVYYYDAHGVMNTEPRITVDGKVCNFYPAGSVVDGVDVSYSYLLGWKKMPSKITRYYGEDEYWFKTGFQSVDGKKYFFDKTSGALYIPKNTTQGMGWYKASGAYYALSPVTGEWIVGLYTDAGGNTYYYKKYDATASYTTGLVSVDGVTYYFDPDDGRMAKNRTVDFGDHQLTFGADGALTKAVGIYNGYCYDENGDLYDGGVLFEAGGELYRTTTGGKLDDNYWYRTDPRDSTKKIYLYKGLVLEGMVTVDYSAWTYNSKMGFTESGTYFFDGNTVTPSKGIVRTGNGLEYYFSYSNGKRYEKSTYAYVNVPGKGYTYYNFYAAGTVIGGVDYSFAHKVGLVVENGVTRIYADGTRGYLRNVSVTVDGVKYTVDADGVVAVPFQSKTTAAGVIRDGILMDGDLSDWKEAEQFPLEVYNSGRFNTSGSEYGMFSWSDDSLYFGLKVTDGTNTMSGLTRDHVRVSVVFPDGSRGLFYSDNDSWHVTDTVGPWWGYTGPNVTVPNNSFTVMNYCADGTVTVEGRICFTEAAWSQVQEGTELKVSVSYFDYMSCTAGSYSGRRWVTFGTHAVNPVNTADITGTVTMGAVASALKMETVYAAPWIETAAVNMDGELNEWNGPESRAMKVLRNGKFVGSDTASCCFQWSQDALFFSVTAEDSTNVVDGLMRDQVRLSVIFPDGSLGIFCADNDGGFWYNCESFWNYGGVNVTAHDCSFALFSYHDDGTVTVEGQVRFRPDVWSRMKNNTVLRMALQYLDHATLNSAEFDGNGWTVFGTEVFRPTVMADIGGVVCLTNERETLAEEIARYDIDRDGAVTESDVTMLRQSLAQGGTVYDVNRDGAFDENDAVWLDEYRKGSFYYTSDILRQASAGRTVTYEGTRDMFTSGGYDILDLGKVQIDGIYADEQYDFSFTVLEMNGIYKIWWCRQDPHDTIWYAESLDLKNWYNALQVITLYQISTPTLKEMLAWPAVLYVNGMYHMFFEAPCTIDSTFSEYNNNIFYATSPDGFRWTFYPDNDNPQPVIVNPRPTAGGVYGVGQPSAFYKDGYFYVSYTDATESGGDLRIARSYGNGYSFEGTVATHTKIIANAPGARVRYNATTGKYYVLFALSLTQENGIYNDQIYMMESDSLDDWPCRTGGQAKMYATCLTQSNAVVKKGTPDFVTDAQGVVHGETMYLIYMDGVMPSPGVDHRVTFPTWDGHIAVVRPVDSTEKFLLPNGQPADELHLQWYRNLILS